MKIIVAADKKSGIAKDGNIPWMGLYPQDMRFFKFMTINEMVICGRKTFETFKKPLTQRHNLVLTRSSKLSNIGYVDPASIVTYAKVDDESEIANWVCDKSSGYPEIFNAFVIGGAEIYNLFLPIVTEIFITRIPEDFGCDTFFYIPDRFTKVSEVELSHQDFPDTLIVEKFIRTYERESLRIQIPRSAQDNAESR